MNVPLIILLIRSMIGTVLVTIFQQKHLKCIILKTIQETCHYVSLNEQEFVYSLQEESAMKDIAVSETVKNRIERNQKRVHELDMLIRKIYEDNVIGRLPDRLFQSMLTDYENEQNELNKIIETDTADMQRIIGGQNNVERFLKLVKKYENITELTPVMINEFIDKILVHEPQGKGADRTTEVEIYLNYVGAIFKYLWSSMNQQRKKGLLLKKKQIDFAENENPIVSI